MKQKTSKVVRYNRWGYIFLIPFIVVFIIFQLVPMVTTVYRSFFENYRSGLKVIGPNFVGLQNYITLLTNGDMLRYFGNTIIMWLRTANYGNSTLFKRPNNLFGKVFGVIKPPSNTASGHCLHLT